jgi:hypothetical protein
LVTHYGVGSLCTVAGVSEQTFCDNFGGDPAGTSFPGFPPLTVSGITTSARIVVIVTDEEIGVTADAMEYLVAVLGVAARLVDDDSVH